MASLQTLQKLEIRADKIVYNKSSKRLSIEILGFTFVGHYTKITTIKTILDEIHKSLKHIQVDRNNLYVLDPINLNPLSESIKLKDLGVPEKKPSVKQKKPSEKQVITDKGKKLSSEPMTRPKLAKAEPIRDEELINEKEVSEEEYMDDAGGEVFRLEEEKKSERKVSAETISYSNKREKLAQGPSKSPSPASEMAPGGAPSRPAPAIATTKAPVERAKYKEKDERTKDVFDIPAPEEGNMKTYDINMGFQYYSVMMEKVSYLFYVYFSQKELIIQNEKGKTIFRTSFQIVTKIENPKLDLRIEGKDFEIHPLTGTIEVIKDYIKPPVMIFSITPKKLESKLKKKKKEEEKRFLHVYIEFEGNTVNHTVLSIAVQPKHYHIDAGPIHINMSKTTAIMISLISILITGISAAYSVLSIDISTSSSTDFLSSLGPGIGSLIFFVIFIITLLKKGVFPIKEQIAGLLNLEKGFGTMK